MKINIEVQPFTVPNYVLARMPPGNREDGIKPDMVPKWRIDELSEESLSELCHEFRAAVFEKAGKKDRADLQQRFGT